jgi:hypothetical protein
MRAFMIAFCLSVAEKVFPGFITEAVSPVPTMVSFLFIVGLVADLRDAFGERGNAKK